MAAVLHKMASCHLVCFSYHNSPAVLRKIASGHESELGDISTLADPGVVKVGSHGVLPCSWDIPSWIGLWDTQLVCAAHAQDALWLPTLPAPKTQHCLPTCRRP